MKNHTLIAALLALGTITASADWRTDIGWDDLQAWATLNGVTLADTSAVTIGMSEAGTSSYAPDTANSQLSDETITDITGDSVSPSSHATGVAGRFFGNTLSISPNVSSVRIYSANDFISRVQNQLASSWSERVMNHSWIGSTGGVNGTTIISARVDETTTGSGTLHCVGMSNSKGGAISELLAHTYNTISVGRTDGNHSYGVIPAGYEGAGRQKPEIVNPQSSSSLATGAASSVVTLLYAAATTANGQLPVTVKSCLLAGADKTQFADWDNTSTRPIDNIYGAGETHILNSYRILTAGEQGSGNIDHYGWDNFSPRGRQTYPQSYTFSVPAYASSANLCANLSWNRNASLGIYSPLADLSLTLKDSSGATLFSSDSPVDNIEHIWQTGLTPGDYTITVDRNDLLSTNYTLAWRVDINTDRAPTTFAQGAADNALTFGNLVPNHSYTLQRSSNLASWVNVATLVSSGSGELNYDDPNATLGEKVFYRLRYYTP